MLITLNKQSALTVLRVVRSRKIEALCSCCNLESPDKGEQSRWSTKRVAQLLSAKTHGAISFSPERLLDVVVPRKSDRLRFVGSSNTVYVSGLPDGSFLDLGDGVRISGPELLFVEMAPLMPTAIHVLLGMELCGSFSRNARDPRGGDVAYGVEPVTSVEKISSFLEAAHGIKGLQAARYSLQWVADNAWSPMEAVLATMLNLPRVEFGYELGPVTMNARVGLPVASGDEQTRVPDIVLPSGVVGFNYDGEGHFGLRDLVPAIERLIQNPGDLRVSQELDELIEAARQGVVGDKRRDRDLMAAGLMVLPVTKEDLYMIGGLDRLVLQAVVIDRAVGHEHPLQEKILREGGLVRSRQDLIWMLLPGSQMSAARHRLRARSKGTWQRF